MDLTLAIPILIHFDVICPFNPLHTIMKGCCLHWNVVVYIHTIARQLCPPHSSMMLFPGFMLQCECSYPHTVLGDNTMCPGFLFIQHVILLNSLLS